MGGYGGGEVEGEMFVRMEGRSLRFGGRRGNVGEISRHSFRVADGRARSVGGSGRTVSGTAKAAPNFGGPAGGVGQFLGQTQALRPPGVACFSVRGPNGA